jgi:hypothetical protein
LTTTLRLNSGIARSGKVLRRILGFAQQYRGDHRRSAACGGEARSADPDSRSQRRAARISQGSENLAGVWRWLGSTRRRGPCRRASYGRVAPKEKVPCTSAPKATAGTIAVAGAAAAQQAHSAGAEPEIIAVIVVVAIALAFGGWFAWRSPTAAKRLIGNLP